MVVMMVGDYFDYDDYWWLMKTMMVIIMISG
jgi:hypothetical protein